MSKLAKALTAAAGNAGESLYVDDVFSTYLYDGTGAAHTITNGIDLSGEGGLTWIKTRSTGTSAWHSLADTERGAGNILRSDLTNAQNFDTAEFTSFNSNGFTVGNDAQTNGSGRTYASWTFRKAEKFFDVQTWTGDGTGARTISHSLNGTVGALFMKATNADMQWFSYHNGLTNAQFLELNATTAAVSSANAWNNTTPTSSEFTVGSYGNISGRTYVAYLFASDAGGFGDDGDENIIKCGSYTGTGSVDTLSIELGFEPQWIMVKSTTTGQSWYMQDIMRGMPVGSSGKTLSPDTSAAESTNKRWFYPTATGVRAYDNEIEYNQSGQTYIYIAIRRPMKTPESGTEVFAIDQVTGAVVRDVGLVPDMTFFTLTSSSTGWLTSRLAGNKLLRTTGDNIESNGSVGWDDSTNSWSQGLDTANLNYFFKRATGFFDAVAYTGTSSARTIPHNLGVVPEFIIVKNRDSNDNWICYHSGNTAAPATEVIKLNETDGTSDYDAAWNDTAPTSSVFTVGSYSATNNTGQDLIAYLFATLAGVSKVGSYTGTGSNVNVDCGFSAGARFILIKRSDSTGDWYVWDSERGIVAGNDPYLLLNTVSAEVTNTDYIDPLSSGFTVTSSAPAALNASGGNYIFLAIA
jgi:hypothetical protein